MIGLFVRPKRRLRHGSSTGQPDVAPPVLTGLVVDAAQQEFTVSCNEVGTLLWVVDSASTYADHVALSAAVGSAEASGSAVVSGGINTISMDLDAVQPGNWRLHVSATDLAGNASAVLSEDLGIVSTGLEMNGDPLQWDGSQLIFNAA